MTSEDFAFNARLRKRLAAFSPRIRRAPSVIFNTFACGGRGASSLNPSAMARKKNALGVSGNPENDLPVERLADFPLNTASAFSTASRDLLSTTSLPGWTETNPSSLWNEEVVAD